LPLPELTVGLVVRYEYLWARRAATAETADKDHPACVVTTFRKPGSDDDFVVYLPISHVPPGENEAGIELTDNAKSASGLDARPQWVLISECNIAAWPFDLRQLPRKRGRFHYGHLPPSVFREIRDQFVALYRAKRVQQVGRTR